MHTGVFCSSSDRVGGQMVAGQRGGRESPDDQADLSAVLKNTKATLNRVNTICSRLQVFGVLAVCTRGRPCATGGSKCQPGAANQMKALLEARKCVGSGSS